MKMILTFVALLFAVSLLHGQASTHYSTGTTMVTEYVAGTSGAVKNWMWKDAKGNICGTVAPHGTNWFEAYVAADERRHASPTEAAAPQHISLFPTKDGAFTYIAAWCRP